MNCYIFDLGSVLVNYSTEQVIERLSSRTGKHVEEIAPLFSHSALYPVETGRQSSPQFFLDQVLPVLPSFSYDEWVQAFVDTFTLNNPAWALMMALRERRRKTYILSNLAEFHKLALERKVQGIFQPFEHCFFSYELGMHKPESKIYQTVCRQVGVPPEQIVFFDDLQANVDGAVRQGMKAYCYHNNILNDLCKQISHDESWEGEQGLQPSLFAKSAD